MSNWARMGLTSRIFPFFLRERDRDEGDSPPRPGPTRVRSKNKSVLTNCHPVNKASSYLSPRLVRTFFNKLIFQDLTPKILLHTAYFLIDRARCTFVLSISSPWENGIDREFTTFAKPTVQFTISFPKVTPPFRNIRLQNFWIIVPSSLKELHGEHDQR